MRIFSWNVNGIRSAAAKGLLEWVAAEQPDVLCLQETKAGAATLPDSLLRPAGYESYWVHALRKGYSGVATYSRLPVRSWTSGLAEDRFDAEGRVLMTDFGDFELYNVYFPNGQASPERLAYKLEFYNAFLRHVDARVAGGRSVIFCGDVNTAHRPIDLAHPKANEKYSGFLPEERVWLDRWLAHGWVDSFRHLYPEMQEAYSWWSFRAGARARNIGWRLDYFFVHSSMLQMVQGAGIAQGVVGADHCPVWLDVAI